MTNVPTNSTATAGPSAERLFFDCNASYGPVPKKHPLARWTLEHLLEDLNLAGIAGALVHHRLANHYDPMFSNRMLIREIAPYRDRLFPCWVVTPNLAGESPEPEALAQELLEHDVPAVRFEFEFHRTPVKDKIWRPLLDVLRHHQRLIILSVNPYEPRFEPVDALLEMLTGTPVVMVNHAWGQWRQVMAMMRTHDHLHLEFSQFQANRVVETCIDNFGAHRCLFGTCLPDKAPGAARGFIDYGLFDDATADLIAGGNLIRLLQGRKPIPADPSPWEDDITRAVKARKPLPCRVIDGHCHLGDRNVTTLQGGVVSPRADIEGMLELTRRMGIAKTAMMSWTAPMGLGTDLGNQVVADAVDRYPEEIIGLSSINPGYDTPEKIQQIIEEYHEKRGFPGLKCFCHTTAFKYDAPEFHTWLQYGNDHKLYMVFDPASGMPTDVLEKLTQRYPDLSIHIDHCGQSWPYAVWAAEMCKRFPNVVAQLNFTLVTNGTIEYLVKEIGADRVLFGTDGPMRDPRPQVTWLAFTKLTLEEKKMVFGEAFARVLIRAGVKGLE